MVMSSLSYTKLLPFLEVSFSFIYFPINFANSEYIYCSIFSVLEILKNFGSMNKYRDPLTLLLLILPETLQHPQHPMQSSLWRPQWYHNCQVNQENHYVEHHTVIPLLHSILHEPVNMRLLLLVRGCKMFIKVNENR